MTNMKVIYYQVDNDNLDDDTSIEEAEHKELMRKLQRLNDKSAEVRNKVEGQKEKRLGSA